MKNYKGKKIKEDKLLIIVRGGVVQNIYSSNVNLEIDLLDYDNLIYPSNEIAEKDLNKRKANKHEIMF